METSGVNGIYVKEEEDVYGIDGISDIEQALELEAIEMEAEESIRNESQSNTNTVGVGSHWETGVINLGHDSNEFDSNLSQPINMDTMASRLDDGNDVQQPIGYGDGSSCSIDLPFHHVGLQESCMAATNETFPPYIGQQFVDDEAAYKFYNTYASKKGFSVRRFRVERSRKRVATDGKGVILSKEFVCSREGRKQVDKQGKFPSSGQHDKARIGCLACIRVRAVHGGWIVDKFVEDHNHELVSEKDIFRLRSHQSMSDSVKGMVDNLLGCGFGPAAIFDVVQQTLGGYGNVGMSEQVFMNYLKRKSTMFVGQDCQHMLDYFYRAQLRDPKFAYSLSTDEDGTLNRVFWVDGRARAAYELFGDVVVFDTTYKKNRYKWPFGPFTGVNHHGQSILFGCGLISDETDVSFEWLFNAWKSAMGNKAPVAIITDMGRGIISSIPRVFPETKHRFCSWHIGKHILEHLGRLFNTNVELKNEFRACLYKTNSVAEFEMRWGKMLDTYQLFENKWLKDMYNLREHWVPVYLRGTFLGGMNSTQRSEGLNYYFRGFFKLSTPLMMFVRQYERAVDRRREREAAKDFKTLSTSANLSSGNPIELQASKVYTRTIFEIFKKRIYQSSYMHANEAVGKGNARTFYIGRFGVPDEHRCVVTYNEVQNDIKCTCNMFEFMGIFCKHIIKLLIKLDCHEIPSKYILKRWTIDARNLSSARDAYVDVVEAHRPLHYWDLHEGMRKVISLASLSNEHCDAALFGLQELFHKISSLPSPTISHGPHNPALITPVEGVFMSSTSVGSVRDPIPTTTVGRPRQIRTKHPMEESNRRQNRCSICKSLGHNKGTCRKTRVTMEGHSTVDMCNRPAE